MWHGRYAGRWSPPAGLTALFEIVYPANRIVIDYGPLDDLILLGFVEIETGQTLSAIDEATFGWPGPVVDSFPYTTFAEALAAEPRVGKEGLVVHFVSSDQRAKVKQEDYVRLHRIVTGLNARVVWEHLRDGKPLAELDEPLPDEFHGWVNDVADHLAAQVGQKKQAIERVYNNVMDTMPIGWVKKDYALKVKSHEQSAALFWRLDNRDYTPMLWCQVDPGTEWKPTSTGAATAA